MDKLFQDSMDEVTEQGAYIIKRVSKNVDVILDSMVKGAVRLGGRTTIKNEELKYNKNYKPEEKDS